MSELKLKVKPKLGDREPTEEDYKSSEEDIDDGECVSMRKTHNRNSIPICYTLHFSR